MSDYLLVDAGNSRLKWAISQRGILSEAFVFSYASDDLQALLTRWSNIPTQPCGVFLANVAEPSLTQTLVRWFKDEWDLSAEIVSVTKEQCGIKNCYVQADRLGVDRWAAMIGARRLISGAACVVDCGTATTLDVIDEDGQHIGGLIVPGVDLMATSLTGNAASLRTDGLVFNNGLLACDTLSALLDGSLLATVGFIERLQRDIREKIKVPFTTFLCGGRAEDLLPLLSDDIRHEPDLVLIGLNTIAMTKA